ncbi:MAG: glycoside hydrolase family 127 protein [Verrucomicrobiota bacterium]
MTCTLKHLWGFAAGGLATFTLAHAADYPVQPVPFTSVKITGGLWHARQETNRQMTLPFAIQQCEASKRLDNFDLAAETLRRRAAGETNFQNKPLTIYPFDDTDPYKTIEGGAYCLSLGADPALQAKLDAFIARIGAAQEPDGYLYSFRTMHPESPAHNWVGRERWVKDPDLSHELYNLGHLYEAGAAYYQATGQTNLLNICLRSAELLEHDFGDGQRRIAPGHQVVEMGLAKLYRATGDRRWIDLAKFFLDVRGPRGNPYNQQHLRVVDQTEAVGHAVRANYMYAGMADVAALTGDTNYLTAIEKIWDNVVSRKWHLTGGCGALANGEAYGKNYELPSNCYNETCAAVAFLFWNHRMFLMTGDAKYMDAFERTLYNGFNSGVSLSGDRFFYPNPLQYDGVAKNNHGFAGRAPWFGCACCPPNALRLIASLGGYFYAVKDDHLFVNLYAQSQGEAAVAGNKIQLRQTANYPWDGKIKLEVSPAKAGTFTLSLRIPGWVQGHPVPGDLYTYEDSDAAKWTVRVNGKKVAANLDHGYLPIARTWKAGDVVELDFPMPVRRVLASEHVAALRSQVALERGPLVYCLEDVGNTNVLGAVLPDNAKIKVQWRGDLLGGINALSIASAQTKVSTNPPTAANFTAIPYYTWNNRGNVPMTVWMKRSEK